MKKLLLQLRIWLLRIAGPDKIMYIGGSDTLPQPLLTNRGGPTYCADGPGRFFRPTNAH